MFILCTYSYLFISFPFNVQAITCTHTTVTMYSSNQSDEETVLIIEDELSAEDTESQLSLEQKSTDHSQDTISSANRDGVLTQANVLLERSNTRVYPTDCSEATEGRTSSENIPIVIQPILEPSKYNLINDRLEFSMNN